MKELRGSKKSSVLPGAGRTRAQHQHGSDTPTSPMAILHHTDQFYVLFFAHDCMFHIGDDYFYMRLH